MAYRFRGSRKIGPWRLSVSQASLCLNQDLEEISSIVDTRLYTRSYVKHDSDNDFDEMNLSRVANVNVFRKVRQLETLVKPGGFLMRTCNSTQFPKSTSSLANLNRCVLPNTNNYTKCRILSKLPAQSTVSVIQSRAVSAHGDHVRLWLIERIVSASFLSLVPAALLFDNKFIEILLATAVVMHTHWGLEAIIVDYARPIVVGTLFPKVAFLLLNVLSAATLAGLLVLIYNGPGLTKTIKSGWKIGQDRRQAD